MTTEKAHLNDSRNDSLTVCYQKIRQKSYTFFFFYTMVSFPTDDPESTTKTKNETIFDVPWLRNQ